jgi:hypothetical protein
MLNREVYEEVEHDEHATAQALQTVVLSSLAAGIGGGVSSTMTLLMNSVGALLSWAVWAALIYVIGAKVLPVAETEADVGQLLRTTGFASAPGILRIFGLVEGIGAVIVGIAGLWMLAAMIVAVRQALDYTSTWRAFGVCVVGWFVLMIFSACVML